MLKNEQGWKARICLDEKGQSIRCKKIFQNVLMVKIRHIGEIQNWCVGSCSHQFRPIDTYGALIDDYSLKQNTNVRITSEPNSSDKVNWKPWLKSGHIARCAPSDVCFLLADTAGLPITETGAAYFLTVQDGICLPFVVFALFIK